jgi:hypothetical protein
LSQFDALPWGSISKTSIFLLIALAFLNPSAIDIAVHVLPTPVPPYINIPLYGVSGDI